MFPELTKPILHLISDYKPLVNRTKPRIKTVQIWTAEASSVLWDCFEDTKWELFEHSYITPPHYHGPKSTSV